MDKEYVLTGCFDINANPNRNGRVYESEVFANALDRYQKKIDSKQAIGTLDHPTGPTISLKDVSHVVTEAKIVGIDEKQRKVQKSIERYLMHTVPVAEHIEVKIKPVGENGKIVKSLLESGIRIDVEPYMIGDKVVAFNLISRDEYRGQGGIGEM